MTKKVNVIKDAINPEPDEVIAAAIIEVSNAMKKFDSGRLKRSALVCLLFESTAGVGKPAIRAVLDSMANLESYWLKPKPKKA